MKNLVLALIIIMPLFVFAQNYRVVSNVIPAYYHTELGYNDVNGIKTFAINSFTVSGSDTLFNTFKTIMDGKVQDWATCIDSSAGSIMGKNLLQQSHRTVLFNYQSDSIFVNQQTNVNDTWKLFQYVNGDFIESEHQQTNYQKVFGIDDSVKIFQLQHKDSEGNIVEDEINGFELWLSENFGLIKTFDTYVFPDYLYTYSLSGCENPELGVQNITAKLAFDFQPGDEFHFYREDLHWYFDDEDTLYKIDYGDERWVMRFVIARTDYQDSVKYEYQECSRIHAYSDDDYDTLYLTETVFETIIYDSVLPGLIGAYSDQKIKMEEWGGVYYEIKQMQDSKYNGHLYKGIVEAAFMDYDTCVVRSFFDPCCYEETFVSGGGGPYYYWSDWFGTTIERELLYFNKDSDFWGEPLAEDCEDLLSDIIVRPEQANSLSIYPNPFNNELTISCRSDKQRIVKITVLDIRANQVLQVNLSDKDYIIQTSELVKGIYILETELEDGSFVRRKVIKN